MSSLWLRLKLALFGSSLVSKAAWSYLIVITLPISILAVIYFGKETDSIRHNFEATSKQNVDFVTNIIQEKQKEVEAVSHILTDNLSLKKYLEYYTDSDIQYLLDFTLNISKFLDAVVTFNDKFHQIHVYYDNDRLDEFGTILLHRSRMERDEDYHKALRLAFNDVLWSGEHPSRIFAADAKIPPGAGDKRVYSMFKKIMSVNYAASIAILEVEVLSSELLKGLDALAPERNDRLLIADASGRIVYSEWNDETGELWDEANAALAKENQPDGQMYANIDYTKYLLTYNTDEKTGMSIVSLLPEKQMSEIITRKKIVIALIFGFVILTMLFIIYFVSILVFRRLNRLKAIMKLVQRGQFDSRMEVDYMDEIGLVIKSFNLMVERTQILINQVYRSQLAEKEAALAYLQSQMNPHFLYNSLEMIRMMALYDGNARVSNAIVMLADVLHYNINGEDTVELREELELVSQYIAIHNLRFNGKIKVAYHVPIELHTHTIKKLLLQPLVENAIMKGFDNFAEGCSITLSAASSNGVLTLTVADNGSGLDEHRLAKIRSTLSDNDEIGLHRRRKNVTDKGTGIGLRNIHNRIRLYYGEGSGLEIDSSPGAGTTVTLTLIGPALRRA